MDNHFDRRERTIYVWMLERNVTDDQLYSLFSKIGPIEKLIFKEYADGTPQHCLIVFRYVDSVLTAMSTLQGAELNGRPISLRPLRESTHAVLMPSSTMYPSSSSSKERRTTVTSSDGGISEHSDDLKKTRTNWDAASSDGSASSGVWTPDALETAAEKLTIDERRGGTVGSRSSASYSSVSSSPPHSLSPPAVIHGSLRKPWRPSRGPIPAPLLTQGVPRYYKEEYGSGGGHAAHAHTNLAHHTAGTPRPLLAHLIPPSPGYGIPSPSPFNHASFFAGIAAAPCSPRPLFPEYSTASSMTSSGGVGAYGGAAYKSVGAHAAPTGVFSPTAAPEEVVWRQHHHTPSRPAPPPTSLMSPPCTAGGRSWFEYGACSVPQAYRGSATESQLSPLDAAGTTDAAPQPLSLGGMLPPNSPPIGQVTRAMFDFADASATLPSRFHHPHPHSHHLAPPTSARPPLPLSFGGRCTPRAPRSAAPFGANPAAAPSLPHHGNSPFAWPEYRAFGGRY